MTTHQLLHQRVMDQAGIPRFSKRAISISDLCKTQWCDEFEGLMRNRMIIGGMRYGLLGQQKAKYNQIASIKRRLAKYEETGNTEHLVDIANLCMVEYVDGVHPNKHFNPSDDGEHTPRK